jgi:small ligand-binding sensory domain FIST
VLLFLTPDFARQAQAAVTAASRAAQCVQIAGACVPGVFTEVDWLIDRPAAAALVLCGDIGTGPARDSDPVISLAQPEAVTASWLAAASRRIGGVSTDSGAQRPGRVWCNSKIAMDGCCSFSLPGTDCRTGVSRGVHALAPALTAETEGYELLRLGGDAALHVLKQQLPDTYRLSALPLHLLYAAVIDPNTAIGCDAAIAEGRFALVPVLSANAEFGSLTLASQVADGARIFWALRQPLAAEQDMAAMLANLRADQAEGPAFALMFSCMGRGPYFYGGADRDLDLFRQRYPGVPLLGAYCAGEIAPLPSGNALVHNSVVLALYDNRADVQPDA